MSELQEIEAELREYLEKEPNLRRDDRLAYLMSIINKRTKINKLDHLITYSDYFKILGQAKSNYVRMKLPARISFKELEANDALHIAVVESVLMYLNKNSLLKKNVNFDYTE